MFYSCVIVANGYLVRRPEAEFLDPCILNDAGRSTRTEQSHPASFLARRWLPEMTRGTGRREGGKKRMAEIASNMADSSSVRNQ